MFKGLKTSQLLELTFWSILVIGSFLGFLIDLEVIYAVLTFLSPIWIFVFYLIMAAFGDRESRGRYNTFVWVVLILLCFSSSLVFTGTESVYSFVYFGLFFLGIFFISLFFPKKKIFVPLILSCLFVGSYFSAGLAVSSYYGCFPDLNHKITLSDLRVKSEYELPEMGMDLYYAAFRFVDTGRSFEFLGENEGTLEANYIDQIYSRGKIYYHFNVGGKDVYVVLELSRMGLIDAFYVNKEG